jgi:hypothetical protein
MRIRFFLARAALFALTAVSLAAQSNTNGTSTARAVRADRAPKLDGKDDDAVWKLAPTYSEFREFQPREDSAPRFKTEFRAAYDDAALYVFIRAFDPHPDSIMRALTRHDQRGPSDQLKIMLDPYHDRRSGFEFAVNPDGVRREFSMANDGDEDGSWDGVWQVATLVDSLGWTAEFRVPFSQLRYADAPTHTFGFGIWRDIERFKERVSWPVYRNSKSGMVSQFGDLTGIDGIPSPRTMEATPYIVAKNLSRSRTTSGFERVQDQTIGGDLKIGLSSNLTLNATLNPDFGQVEADPAVLNLSAFETFLQERRPFFVEGSGLYQFGVNCSIANCSGEGLFYSRRIGRSPQLSGSYGDNTTATATPILAAAKLTGRTAKGFSLGVLDAITPRMGGTLARTMEPQTNYTVARAQQELNGGNTDIGAIATYTNRSLDQWTQNSLRRSAGVYGGDFRHRFYSKNYAVAGKFTMSQVTGSPAAIASTQRSSAHYYQRPDGELRLDTTATSLGGYATEAAFGKYGGKDPIRFETSFNRTSPGYEVNDLGYMRRADQQQWSTWFALQYRTPTKLYKSAQLNFNNGNSWTTAGLALDRWFNTNWHINFTNNWWGHIGGTIANVGEIYCDRCTRGGPALRVSRAVYPWFGFNMDDRKPIVPYMFFNFGSSDEGRSDSFNTNGGADFKFSTNLSASAGISYSTSIDNAQWIGNFTDATNKTHYAFARLNQKTVSFSVRATYTATPNLTFETYAEPFVTLGTYTNPRELSATPRAASYDARYQAYTVPGGAPTGFTFRSVKSNSVMRWEYRPGSTLFVVWQHGRESGQDDPKNRTIGHGMGELFSLHPDNTFLVKFAYWLSR